MEQLSLVLYIVSAIFFIIGLKKLGNAQTAKQGNFISAIGMFIAVLTTVIGQLDSLQYIWILIAVVLGSVVGVVAAKKVEMTAMPEMIALFNGFGGVASLLVAYAEFQKYISEGTILNVSSAQIAIIVTTIFIGGITFTGSLIAWGKLSEKMTSKPILYKGQQIVNITVFVLFVLASILISVSYGTFINGYVLFIFIVLLSLVAGVIYVIPIGGGDMPVVISLLNAFSGVAACAAGFAISNTILIVTGALVGSSGIILTNIMCKSMNRKLQNVLFSGFGNATGGAGGKESQGEVQPVSVEDTYLMLEAANNVLIVPGYGMAVAQAQHAVQELAAKLEENGCEVNFAIHPVAGRMPGHMNVLLAESNVPYEQLKEMDDVNPTIENVDICMIIGANDIVNPAAREDETSPVYGMPIINVDFARTVIVLKRSMNPGFAGIENPLFFKENTRMLFGDAKKTVQELVAEFKS